MILLWNHSHGKREQQNLAVCNPLAIPEAYEEAEMIENGWLAQDRPIWHEGRYQEAFYQSRSTRFRLRHYRQSPNKRECTHQGKPIQMMEIVPEKNFLRWTGLQQVYDTHLKRTKQRDIQNPLTYISSRDTFLLYYTDEITNLIGFTKIKRYWYQEDLMNIISVDRDDRHSVRNDCTGIESAYHAAIVPISKSLLEKELSWAKRKGANYFYMGRGYEQSSVYRSTQSGFQWWTGVTWSSNRKQFERLCRRDSQINLIRDIKN